jgi:hypothetical protein
VLFAGCDSKPEAAAKPKAKPERAPEVGCLEIHGPAHYANKLSITIEEASRLTLDVHLRWDGGLVVDRLPVGSMVHVVDIDRMGVQIDRPVEGWLAVPDFPDIEVSEARCTGKLGEATHLGLNGSCDESQNRYCTEELRCCEGSCLEPIGEAKRCPSDFKSDG